MSAALDPLATHVREVTPARRLWLAVLAQLAADARGEAAGRRNSAVAYVRGNPRALAALLQLAGLDVVPEAFAERIELLAAEASARAGTAPTGRRRPR